VLSLAHEGEFSKGKVKKQLVLFLDEVETCAHPLGKPWRQTRFNLVQKENSIVNQNIGVLNQE